MMTPARLVRLWRLARVLQRKADEGCELISVPRWLAPELHQLIWTRRMERAEKKWADRAAEVPVSDWQATMQAKADKRLPHD